ncbi:MAG: MATE family efflux transporter [Lachnospiraceae bacterium]
MFGQSMNSIIRADGSPKFAMVSILAGAVVNTILDPVFIFVFRWGMMGAAMAAINNMLKKYGALDLIFGQAQYAQIPMAVVGIVMKFFQIIISIVVGLAAGVPTSVLHGRKKSRVELFTKLLLAEAAEGAVGFLFAECFPRQLISIFGSANESVYYTDFAVKAFRMYLCLIILACVNKACFIFLQAMGKAVESTALSMIREVVFGVGFALLLPVFFGLDGVLLSMPVSDMLTFLVALVLICNTYKELNKTGEAAL